VGLGAKLLLHEVHRCFQCAAGGGLGDVVVFCDGGIEVAQHAELLLEQESGGCGKIELVEKAQTTLAEEVSALRGVQVVLGSEKAMDAVAHSGALPNAEGALVQNVLALPSGLRRNVNFVDHFST